MLLTDLIKITSEISNLCISLFSFFFIHPKTQRPRHKEKYLDPRIAATSYPPKVSHAMGTIDTTFPDDAAALWLLESALRIRILDKVSFAPGAIEKLSVSLPKVGRVATIVAK
jgi:hypothetical protein